MMTCEEGINALNKIIDASISDAAKRTELKNFLMEVYKEDGEIVVKGILYDCNKYGDKEISKEISDLIKEVFFNFG